MMNAVVEPGRVEPLTQVEIRALSRAGVTVSSLRPIVKRLNGMGVVDLRALLFGGTGR